MSTLQEPTPSFAPAVSLPEPSRWKALLQRPFWILWLEHAILLCLVILVVAVPHPTRIVLWSFRIALGLWIVRNALGRDLKREPLFLPVLAFFIVAGISCLFSYDPLLSWTRLGWFSLIMLAVIVPSAVKTTAQLRLLVMLLLVSSMGSVARTAWQYTAGIGTKLVYVRRYSSLATAGLWSGDMIQSINGHSTRTPWQWKKTLEVTRKDKLLRLHVARNYPLHHFEVTVPRGFLYRWLAEPTSTVARGTPVRAQGHFYNSVPYAGLLMILAIVAWGLLLASPGNKWKLRVLLGITFISLVASLWATVTRAYLLSLLIACFLLLCTRVRWRMRLIAATVILVAIAVTSEWIHDKRNVGWLGEKDPYRVMMWKDSVRLVAQHPLFGVGWDSVFTHGGAWGLEAYQRFPRRAGHFHSTPIQIAVDSGLIGLAVWIVLMLAFLRLAIRILKRSGRADWFSRGLAYGVLGSAIAFLLGSIVHYTLGDAEVMALIWLLMGVAIVLWRTLPGPRGPLQETLVACESYATTHSS